MVVFILQSLFLIAAAFIAGAILGSIFKRFSRKKQSVSEHSTRAADARLASIRRWASRPMTMSANRARGRGHDSSGRACS